MSNPLLTEGLPSMDTDDDVSALEEEEVGIWDPSPAPSLGLRQSPSSSPDSDTSLEISSSSDEEGRLN